MTTLEFTGKASERARAVLAKFGVFVAVALAAPTGGYLAHEAWISSAPDQVAMSSSGSVAVRLYNRPDSDIPHLSVPETVKGIYVTSDAYGEKRLFDKLLSLVGRTELNSMVIDLKDSRGALAFDTDHPDLEPYAAKRRPLGELSSVAENLHAEGIYVIARIPVFQDRHYAEARTELTVKRSGGGIWRDRRGIPWLDPSSQEVWKYNVEIASAAWLAGFDEIQFDYIRFPSDGDLSTLRYDFYDKSKTKYEAMGEFFEYLDKELRQKLGARISVDLFGLVMWQHEYDLGIGQRLREAMPRFDWISPMVYPSHYASGFQGFANPALYPYEVVRDNMARGQKLREQMAAEGGGAALAKFRPWLQDFDLGADYGADRVRAQIRASMEEGASGWLLWNAGNVYTESALEKDE
jgi:hypothetical protein